MIPDPSLQTIDGSPRSPKRKRWGRLLIALTPFFHFSCSHLKEPAAPSAGYPFRLHRQVAVGHQLQWSKIDKLQRSQAAAITQDRIKILNNLFARSVDPYLGVISLPEKCLPQHLPPPVQDEPGSASESSLFFLYSSDRLVVGECPADSALMKTTYQHLYCEKEETLYLIKYFYPEGEAWNTRPVAQCDSQSS